MGKLVVSNNVSLDGVIQDPAGDEGFARGGWVGLIKDRPDLSKLALDDALATEAMLMGRRTYECSEPGLEVEARDRWEIVVPASFQLVRTLMEHDLVDELRLKIFPVVLGAGERLFGETSGTKAMRLVDVRILDGDTAYLIYKSDQAG